MMRSGWICHLVLGLLVAIALTIWPEAVFAEPALDRVLSSVQVSESKAMHGDQHRLQSARSISQPFPRLVRQGVADIFTADKPRRARC